MKLKLFSTKINISYAIICVAVLSIVTNTYKAFIWCVLSVIIHESGHILAMYILDYPPEKIKVSLFEIKIYDSSRPQRSDRENLIIIFFGPFSNFICFLLLFLLYLTGAEFLLPFAIANLSVGFFNILPAMSLDGGQMLYILFCKRYSEKQSENAVYLATLIVIIPLSAAGFVVLFNSRYNFSLLFVCVYLVFSLIFKNNKYY